MCGSGSGYIHRRSQSMAINATEQGERNLRCVCGGDGREGDGARERVLVGSDRSECKRVKT